MNAPALLAVFTAACFVAVIGFELGPRPALVLDTGPAVGQSPATAPSALQEPTGSSPGTRVDTLLARPLFSQTRRAPPAASASASPQPVSSLIPRMTGILIDGPRRRAIFAAQAGVDGDKPTVVAEGGLIGPFTVRSIQPQKVIVTGPDGERTVRTGFDPDLQPPPPPPAPLSPAPLPYGLDLPKVLTTTAPVPSVLGRSLPFLVRPAVNPSPQAIGAAR